MGGILALAMRDREYIAASSIRFPVETETYRRSDNAYEFMAAPTSETRNSSWFSVGVESFCALPFVANTARAASMAVFCTTMVTSPSTALAETRPHYRDIIGAVKVSLPNCAKLDAAMVRLERLAGKQAGWKGDDSVPLSAATKAAAEEFLRVYFKNQSLPSPFIGLDADGDITLYWKGEHHLIDLSILPNNRFSYYAEFNDISIEQDDAEIGALPPEIISRLAAVKA